MQLKIRNILITLNSELRLLIHILMHVSRHISIPCGRRRVPIIDGLEFLEEGGQRVGLQTEGLVEFERHV